MVGFGFGFGGEPIVPVARLSFNTFGGLEMEAVLGVSRDHIVR